MPGTPRLTDAEVAEIRRHRPAMRASLACEGLYLPDEVEALFDQLEAEQLPPDERAARIIESIAPSASRRRSPPCDLAILAERAGHEIDLARVDPTAWNRASIEGFYKLNHEPLREVIAGALVSGVRRG